MHHLGGRSPKCTPELNFRECAPDPSASIQGPKSIVKCRVIPQEEEPAQGVAEERKGNFVMSLNMGRSPK
jgi:hypothetical protein